MSVEFNIKRGSISKFWNRHGDVFVALAVAIAVALVVVAIVFVVPTAIATHAECARLHEMNGWDTQVRAMTCYVRLDGNWIPSGQVGYYLGGSR
jgi:hypothetical protein